MALVKITWTETVEFEREVEVDGYDHEGTPAELMEALTNLIDRTEAAEEVKDSLDIQITGHEIVRAGEEPVEIREARKQYEEMF